MVLMDDSMSITEASRVSRRNDMLAQEVEGATVMTDVATGYYYGLESTARRIWELIEQPKSVSEICSILGAEFEVDSGMCETDVIEFLRRMNQEGLVHIAA